MAFVLTYDTLTTLIPSYLERTDSDIIDNIPTFILLAQTRISREAKSLGLEVYVQGVFTPGEFVIPKPAFWLNTLSFQYGSGTGFNTSVPMKLRTLEYARLFWTNPNKIAAPLYYSDYGYSNWLITPTPDQAYPFEIAYCGQLDPIDSTQQTNWLTQYAPELLIYASLLEAMIFIKNDERTQYFMNLYQQSLQNVMTESQSRLTDRAQDTSKG